MMILIISLGLFWLARQKPTWLWLTLPVGLFWDLWHFQPLGLSGLKILLLSAIFWLVFGQVLNQAKLKFPR